MINLASYDTDRLFDLFEKDHSLFRKELTNIVNQIVTEENIKSIIAVRDLVSEIYLVSTTLLTQLGRTKLNLIRGQPIHFGNPGVKLISVGRMPDDHNQGLRSIGIPIFEAYYASNKIYQLLKDTVGVRIPRIPRIHKNMESNELLAEYLDSIQVSYVKESIDIIVTIDDYFDYLVQPDLKAQ